ncbi:cytochrome c oxidase subunit III [Thermaerobacter marianensis DSM 12885]|uniref:Cytochrome c oxidase subunit III n=1 Tax=Thermaerobacter marianensis (strain ATCC 700841 / DSM 12885 / JCM 10246 / 7p75a) TaxID=644966 RepID=E6SGB0_THEM7|nr:cytochrome c oxidase subunit 3 [Thermaerobacter marianensis]ADU50527.1 cytochrome c oxidase subunit III [Thermaerobacter marianensis DSM 12885]
MPTTTRKPPRTRHRLRRQGAAARPPVPVIAGRRVDTPGRIPPNGRGGGGGWGGGPGDDEARARAATMATWMVVAAVTLMFMGFTSTYVARSAEPGWARQDLPPLLWWNTAVLLASSVTMELARRRARKGLVAGARRALGVTTLLGLAFVAGQVAAWAQWLAAGVVASGSTHAAFFYLLSGVHAAHVAGGLGALLYGMWRLGRPGTPAQMAASMTNIATYWHFVDVLWLYLFALLLW